MKSILKFPFEWRYEFRANGAQIYYQAAKWALLFSERSQRVFEGQALILLTFNFTDSPIDQGQKLAQGLVPSCSL